MTMTTAQMTGNRPRRSTLGRATAWRLAATEYERYLDLLQSLSPDEWSRPTDCPAWDVRAMAAHNLGQAEMAGSLPEFVRQFIGMSRREESGVDALTAHQVEARSHLTPADIVERYRRVIPRAVRGRGRRSRLAGGLNIPEKQVVAGAEEVWTFGYLFETILTRDTWMHRVDTAEATGRPAVLTAEHDGVLVADVVMEWAARHGKPFSLHLTGPAGGRWQVGDGGIELTLDAVLFARTLSGRVAGNGLLAVEVPF
jgi:uncharacterized protein (TIGR03083 family)